MTHPMRVLRVAYVPDNRSGGMSRTMYATGDELAARGHEIEYWFSDKIEVSCRVQFSRFAEGAGMWWKSTSRLPLHTPGTGMRFLPL
jgi:hypothetical protein